tara:strand:+ start:15638 stop:16960 length:1323 start_codon:yes stop_codon:yes gene_type:complete
MNKKYKSKKKKRFHIGGEVIDHGGFGCIFKPSLRCINSDNRSGDISKMFLNKYITQEWAIINAVKEIVMNIPNYENYFLINDFEMCQPAELDDNDKINIDNCKNLIKYQINKENINSKLNEVKIINMPFGGKNIYKIFKEENHTQIGFSNINNALINLLINGIKPMNKLGLYHFDIKDENIVFKDGFTKLIDWGHSGISTPTNSIPTNITRLALSYNLPFSVTLFTNEFNKFYTSYLSSIKSPKSFNQLKSIMEQYYYMRSMPEYGHIRDIRKIYLPHILKLSIKNVKSIDNLILDLISSYCAKVLIKYTDFTNKIFNKERYFKEVFSHNVDVYGFIMTYIYLIITDYLKDETPYFNLYKINVANIIIKYCYSDFYADKPFDIDNLIFDLKNIMNVNYKEKLHIELIIPSKTKHTTKTKSTLQKRKKKKKTTNKRKTIKK